MTIVIHDNGVRTDHDVLAEKNVFPSHDGRSVKADMLGRFDNAGADSGQLARAKERDKTPFAARNCVKVFTDTNSARTVHKEANRTPNRIVALDMKSLSIPKTRCPNTKLPANTRPALIEEIAKVIFYEEFAPHYSLFPR